MALSLPMLLLMHLKATPLMPIPRLLLIPLQITLLIPLLHLSLLSLRSHGAAPTDAVFTTPAWLKEHGLATLLSAVLSLLIVSAFGAASEAIYQIHISFNDQSISISL